MLKNAFRGGFACAFALALAIAAPATGQVVGTPGAPSAFGLSGGVGAVSLTGSYGKPRGGVGVTRFDASTAFGVGFGDPVDGVGVQVGVNITSFRKFGDSGYFTAGVHKMFQLSDAGVYSIGINIENIATWGDAKQSKLGANVIGSYMTSINGQLGLITVGATNAVLGNKPTGIFAVGMGVTETSSIALSQLGNRSTLGYTIAPSGLSGTSVNLSVARDWKSKENSVAVDLISSFNLFGN
jgi:hypothetical protein